jgi:hypothetical protein
MIALNIANDASAVEAPGCPYESEGRAGVVVKQNTPSVGQFGELTATHHVARNGEQRTIARLTHGVGVQEDCVLGDSGQR